ncbi:hypothetical protein T265_04617 [Opisthorchis viverrini]|uniref:Uncharacterized protein n=1 Tax=Opisthorchis viverrini TaxID=6198 RepID=A0A074ZMF8_OPIVI|nr:hypothetical protein T265_04617 [Opisthorchis viverrini]KER28573.1 hypothetical protein T265_04617 [Opisthorchis viverrini]
MLQSRSAHQLLPSVRSSLHPVCDPSLCLFWFEAGKDGKLIAPGQEDDCSNESDVNSNSTNPTTIYNCLSNDSEPPVFLSETSRQTRQDGEIHSVANQFGLHERLNGISLNFHKRNYSQVCWKLFDSLRPVSPFLELIRTHQTYVKTTSSSWTKEGHHRIPCSVMCYACRNTVLPRRVLFSVPPSGWYKPRGG